MTGKPDSESTGRLECLLPRRLADAERADAPRLPLGAGPPVLAAGDSPDPRQTARGWVDPATAANKLKG